MPLFKLETQTLILVSDLLLTETLIRICIFHLLEAGPAHPLHAQVKLFLSFTVSIDLYFDGAIVVHLQTEEKRVTPITCLQILDVSGQDDLIFIPVFDENFKSLREHVVLDLDLLLHLVAL